MTPRDATVQEQKADFTGNGRLADGHVDRACTRTYLVEPVLSSVGTTTQVRLASLDDEAQGQPLRPLEETIRIPWLIT
jgi:hypothetical protein